MNHLETVTAGLLKPLNLKVPTLKDPAKYSQFIDLSDPQCFDHKLKQVGSQKYSLLLRVLAKNPALLTRCPEVRDSYLQQLMLQKSKNPDLEPEHRRQITEICEQHREACMRI